MIKTLMITSDGGSSEKISGCDDSKLTRENWLCTHNVQNRNRRERSAQQLGQTVAT